MSAIEPPSEMMRYGPMVDWLKRNKIPECEVRKLIELGKDPKAAGGIKPGYLRTAKKKGSTVRAWYSASQIQRDVLKLNGETK